VEDAKENSSRNRIKKDFKENSNLEAIVDSNIINLEDLINSVNNHNLNLMNKD
jgi:hypothetical protein